MWKNLRNWEKLDGSTREDNWLATGREIYSCVGCERGKAIKIWQKSKRLKQIEIETEAEKCTKGGKWQWERVKRKGKTWKWGTENLKRLLKGRWIWPRESGHAEMKTKTVIRSACEAESEKWDEGKTNEKRENMCVFFCVRAGVLCLYIYFSKYCTQSRVTPGKLKTSKLLNVSHCIENESSL